MCEIGKQYPNQPVILLNKDHAHFQGEAIELIALLAAGIEELNELFKKTNDQNGSILLDRMLERVPAILKSGIPTNS